jgi:transcriptional regulator with XRE-family HTH domain
MINEVNGVPQQRWVGRDIERLRKFRGLRREELAAQMRQPVSVSTIRNIEHDETYNVSLEQLRHMAEVLGARLSISFEFDDEHDVVTIDEQFVDRRETDNEYFIRLVRSRYPECPLSNSQIGRRMWNFAFAHGAELVRGRKQIRITPEDDLGSRWKMPTTVARYTVRGSDFALLEKFADRLGRAYRNERGQILVPIA